MARRKKRRATTALVVADESHALKRVERLLIHFERWTELLREVSPRLSHSW